MDSMSGFDHELERRTSWIFKSSDQFTKEQREVILEAIKIAFEVYIEGIARTQREDSEPEF